MKIVFIVVLTLIIVVPGVLLWLWMRRIMGKAKEAAESFGAGSGTSSPKGIFGQFRQSFKLMDEGLEKFKQLGQDYAEGQRIAQEGEPAQATIKDVKETGITMQNVHPVFMFTLEIRRAKGMAYEVTLQSMVPRPYMGMIAPGRKLAVKVLPTDPQKVAIDWSQQPS